MKLFIVIFITLVLYYCLHFISVTTQDKRVIISNVVNQSPNSNLTYTLVPQKELQEELCSVPLDNQEREAFMAKLFIQAGAKPEQIQKQALEISENPFHNIYLVKKGKTNNVIVVGGHIDHVSVGHGIIDDWSGACLVTNIFQAIKDVPTSHTIVFIGFAGEEKGLLESKAYVRSLTEEAKTHHKAMINLECLGAGESLIWVNGSDKDLVNTAHNIAEKEKLPLFDHILQNVGADSNSFREAKIPAITLDGLPENKFSFIHSANDKCENVNQDFYYNSYRLVVNYLLELDNSLSLNKNEQPK